MYRLGSHCLEMEYTYKVRFEFPEGMEDINVDSVSVLYYIDKIYYSSIVHMPKEIVNKVIKKINPIFISLSLPLTTLV